MLIDRWEAVCADVATAKYGAYRGVRRNLTLIKFRIFRRHGRQFRQDYVIRSAKQRQEQKITSLGRQDISLVTLLTRNRIDCSWQRLCGRNFPLGVANESQSSQRPGLASQSPVTARCVVNHGRCFWHHPQRAIHLSSDSAVEPSRLIQPRYKITAQKGLFVCGEIVLSGRFPPSTY